MSDTPEAPNSKEDIDKMVEDFSAIVGSHAEDVVAGAERGSNAWAGRWSEAVLVLKGTGFKDGDKPEEGSASKE